MEQKEEVFFYYTIDAKPGWQTPSFCPYLKKDINYQKVVKLCEIFNLDCLCTKNNMCLVCKHIMNSGVYPLEIKTFEDWKLQTIFTLLLPNLNLNLEKKN